MVIKMFKGSVMNVAEPLFNTKWKYILTKYTLCVKIKKNERGKVKGMVDFKNLNIKPIQATPTLSGEDAARIIAEANTPPSEEALKRLEMLEQVFDQIRKL